MDAYISEICAFSYKISLYSTAVLFIEKGKLKHATVSPEPGETKDIRSFKVILSFSWHLAFSKVVKNNHFMDYTSWTKSILLAFPVVLLS